MGYGALNSPQVQYRERYSGSQLGPNIWNNSDFKNVFVMLYKTAFIWYSKTVIQYKSVVVSNEVQLLRYCT